jgi:hypothetical protein
MYSSGEGLTLRRAERRAAPKPARIPRGDRPMYSSGEGLQVPKPARIPSGDRLMYSSDEGST